MNGVFQDGREAVVSAGQFVIYDTTRPYELRFDDSFSQTIFQMPRKLLQQRIGSFDALTATTFSSDRPLERLAYEFLLGMSKTIDHVDPATATRLLDQALDLVAMAFADRMHAAFAGSVVSQVRAALSSQELYPDASARPRIVDAARRGGRRNLAALCQRFDGRRTDSRSAATSRRNAWSDASAICRTPPTRPGTSATSHSHGASTTSPTSAGSSSRGSAPRRANGASTRRSSRFPIELLAVACRHLALRRG